MTHIGEVQKQNASQHEDATEECIEQELPRRIDASRHTMPYLVITPDTDQQEHRSQLDFPEQEEEDQINRHKDTHHTRFQQQDQGNIFFDALFFPAANNS